MNVLKDIPKHNMSWLQENWFKAGLLVALIVLGLGFLSTKQPEMCEFALEDVKTYFNEYPEYLGEGIAGASWDFEGLIRNKSQKQQHLKAVIAKLYNESSVLIGDGYTGVEQDLDSNTAVPFKVRVYASRNNTEQWHYYQESSDFQPDIYPWFTTCK